MTEYEIAYVAPGIPAAQGSKDQFGRESSRHVKPWRAVVADCAQRAGVEKPFDGPVVAVVDFVFPRPKAHYVGGNRDGKLRETAPFWHIGKPDLDKLQRAIGDAMSGVVVRDDAQIVRWVTRKFYGSRPCAVIRVAPIGSVVADRQLDLKGVTR